MESATQSIGEPFRVANELLLRVLRDESSDHEIAFICECERLGCYAAVWLTPAAYEARLRASQPIVCRAISNAAHRRFGTSSHCVREGPHRSGILDAAE